MKEKSKDGLQPAYKPDDGPLTDAQINLIRKLSGVHQFIPMTSSLFEVKSVNQKVKKA